MGGYENLLNLPDLAQPRADRRPGDFVAPDMPVFS